MRRWLFAAMAAGGWLCAAAVPVLAQEPRWEVEGYAGFVAGQATSAGTLSLPPAGPPLVTSTPTFPSRVVPSWFFGDGSTLVNGVNADFNLAGRVAPLDAVFSPLQSGHRADVGVRVRRWLSARYAIEVAVDVLGSADLAPQDFAASVEATRGSFVTAFTDLLASGPIANVSVGAQAATQGGSARDTAVTGAIVRQFLAERSLSPYVTFGGGVVTGSGTLPSATLVGRYAFSVLGQVPIDESDHAGLRYEHGATFTFVAGGGVRKNFSSTWGLRADVRMHIGPDGTRVLVDAQPASVRGTPAGFVESFTNPAIQFSNDPATGRQSSLSGAGLQSFEVFKGGTRARTQITVGVIRRF
jgi:hypothetical protein